MVPDVVEVIGFTLFPLIGGIVGPILVKNDSNTEWYNNLNKPWFDPPEWVFGPVWTVLYIMMGYASYLVYKELQGKAGQEFGYTPLYVFYLQLIVNWIWYPVNFGLHDLADSALLSVVLLILVLVTFYLFYQVNAEAGLLLVPYIAWAAFATILSFAYYKLNKPYQVVSFL